MGEMISFPSNGSQASGYLATPVEGGPGLVVIQEWWGLDDSNARAHHPEAAATAWERTVAFMSAQLGA